MEECRERILLSQEAAQAIERSYKSREEHDRVAANKSDSAASAEALTEARTAERLIISKLNQHRKVHGC